MGITRYSVFQPDSGAWNLSRDARGLQDYRDALWAPERLNPRATIFLDLGAPILQRLADRHDYTHIVQYSDTMPELWLSQLRVAAQRYPVLTLVEASTPPDLGRLVHQIVRDSDRPSRPVVQFRLDDDDLVGVDYLDRIAEFSTRADAGRAISLATGYTGFFRDGGLVGPVRKIRRVFGAQGLAYVGWYDRGADRVDIKAGGKHYQVDRRMPTLVDSRVPAYFQMRHVGQDTLLNEEEAERAIQASLEKLTVIKSTAAVANAFPTLADLLPRGA